MDNKCSKYEGLFIFSDEKTLQEHIESCEECKHEHEKMQKVSDLLSEVKLYYKGKKQRFKKLKAICAAFFLVIFSTTSTIVYNDTDVVDSIVYGDTLSAEDLGFPVDDDGLLMVD
ncbi:MAG: hypothetical protein MJ231_01520 [bacterium]|nr:hypothetical protein [bacterium]